MGVNAAIIGIMRDYEPYYTEDGSIGLYSYADKDVFHSKYGALTEAWEKFVIPADIDGLNKDNIKVLDICYGIGYNTKALMSFIINKNKKNKKTFLKKIIELLVYYVSIGINKLLKRGVCLLRHSGSIDANKILASIDCLELNEELVKLSPLFKTVKTPEEIYYNLVPKFLNCFDTYYSAKNLFVNIMSKFSPRNRKEINELLEIKFKNMHINKEYKIHPYVNYIILNTLYEKFDTQYWNKDFKKMVTRGKNRRFFDKTLIKYARFNQIWGYNSLRKANLSAFLHNIYYHHLSKRDKNINFKTAESLFKLNFYINDARKSILQLNAQYDLIFLDAFTYTKAPHLWSAEFIAELYKRLSPNGALLTYSNSVLVRNTLLEAGFYVGKIYNEHNNKFIGTIASKDKSKIKHPLDNYELGLCATKAGIPYHDPNLSFDKKDILALREYEFRHSNLMSSSKYMKIRSLNNE